MYLIFSSFILSPTSLASSSICTSASFSCPVLLPIQFTSSAYAKICSVLVYRLPPLLMCICLITFSKTTLNNYVDSASPCLKPLFITNSSVIMFCTLTLPVVFLNVIPIRFTSFLGTLNSSNIKINFSLFILSYACLTVWRRIFF